MTSLTWNRTYASSKQQIFTFFYAIGNNHHQNINKELGFLYVLNKEKTIQRKTGNIYVEGVVAVPLVVFAHQGLQTAELGHDKHPDS